MSTPTTVRRPGGVTFVGILVGVAAVYNLVVGAWLVISPIGDNPTVWTLTDGVKEIPGWYLLLIGAMYVVLGLLYLWLMRLTFAGSATAQMLITVLAIINIVFALFNLPWGFASILVNALIVLLVNTGSAKEFFRTMP